MMLAVALLASVSSGLDNGLGRTPQMGWNSWNKFHCDVNETIVRETAQRFISLGLKDAGYEYINIDDCWQVSRKWNGEIVVDQSKFPSGMKALADYVHSLDLKFGVYSDAGFKTCAGRPGSILVESIDAKTYASWGVDYLKYDNCFTFLTPKWRYPRMRDALNATGRPIFFSMCEWGVEDPAKWASSVGNSWRTTQDIEPSWKSFMSIADQNNKWADYAGPGGWNDPDMLEVGNPGLSLPESRTHFSLWSIMKAPLLIGCDLQTVTEEVLSILKNPEVIAVNQDKLGKQGKKVHSVGDFDLWAGPLSDSSYAAVVVNKGEAASKVEVNLYDLIPQGELAKSYLVRDLWSQKDLGSVSSSMSFSIESHDSVMLKLTPVPTL